MSDQSFETQLAVMSERWSTIEKELSDIKRLIREVKDKYVSQYEFDPVETRVGQLEDSIKWIVRLALGLLVSTIISVVFAIQSGLI